LSDFNYLWILTILFEKDRDMHKNTNQKNNMDKIKENELKNQNRISKIAEMIALSSQS